MVRRLILIEVNLNNGMFREIDLSKPVYCVKCKMEIIRDSNSVNLNIDVHTLGYAFCEKCKKKLNKFAGQKLANYERELVEEFINEG